MRQNTGAAEHPGPHEEMHFQIFDFEQAHDFLASRIETSSGNAPDE
jgi:hypothetical protein